MTDAVFIVVGVSIGTVGMVSMGQDLFAGKQGATANVRLHIGQAKITREARFRTSRCLTSMERRWDVANLAGRAPYRHHQCDQGWIHLHRKADGAAIGYEDDGDDEVLDHNGAVTAELHNGYPSASDNRQYQSS